MKITEIRVLAGKETYLLTPESAQAIVGQKTFFLDEKLARKLWKEVAGNAEKMCEAFKGWKP